jgi:hypothetical protein
MEGQVSKGFIVFAQNTDSVDYIQQAYALALSIKFTQLEVTNISIVTSDSVPEEYQHAFDQIIPIPWLDEKSSSKFAAEHRWKLYHASPYHETIVLDTDMLLLEDISSWWKYCSNYNIRFCNNILNYKLEHVSDIVHRKVFISNKLTNPYFALHYFKKSETSLEFYRVLEFVVNNWELCWDKFASSNYQKWLSMDLAVAVATELSLMHDEVMDNTGILKFVHMKTPIQGWDSSYEKWTDAVSYVLNSRGEFLVNNIKQPALFHYVEKDFITPKMLDKLEELCNG